MAEPTDTPAQGQRLDGAQMLRAVAAGAVLVHHTLQQSNGATSRLAPDWLTTAGAAGVDLFFVISGFIMAWIAFRAPGRAPRPGRFIVDRLTRILPLFWLCCAATLAVAAVGFLRSADLSPGSVVLSLLLLPHEGRLLGVAWTLEYELLFYAVFALCLPLRSLTRSTGAAGVAIAALVLAAPVLPPGTVRAFLGNPIMLEFVGGMAIAWLSLRRPDLLRVPLALAVAAGAVLMLAPMWVLHETTDGLRGWPRLMFWGLPAMLVVAHAVTALPRPGAVTRALVRLGDASYALYLTHAFVMIGYAAVLKRTALREVGQGPAVVVVSALSIVVALLAHRLVELPVTRAVRRVLAGGIPRPAGTRPGSGLEPAG